MFQASRDGRQWRIVFVLGGVTRDLCGAVDEAVAWAQSDILNYLMKFKSP